MKSRIPNIRAAAYAAIWAIQEHKLEAVLDFLELRAAGHQPAREVLRDQGIIAATRPKGKTVGQIAVLPLQGVIAQHAGMDMAISGGTSTEAFGRSFDEAVSNPDIGAIVIDCDSPGGAIEGVPELAAKIFKARGKKPITAVVNAHMHSAAYWIASQADEIVCTPSGQVGDIGVMTMRTDTTAADAAEGVTYTLIKAGEFKGEGIPETPLSEDELAARQASVDAIYSMFVKDVARARGVTTSDVTGGYGQGRSVTAKQAVAIGLVDRIATLDQTLAGLGGAVAAPRRSLNAAGEPAQIAAVVNVDVTDALAAITEVTDLLTSLAAPDAAITAAAGSAARVIPIRAAGGAAAASPIPPERPTKAKEHVVDEDELKAQAAEKLKAERKIEADRISAITALCSQEGTMDKLAEFVASGASVDAVGLSILNAKRAARAADPTIKVGHDRELDKPFASLGEQLQAIAAYTAPSLGLQLDKRVVAAAAGASANVGSDGAFAIQSDFQIDLAKAAYDEGQIANRCSQTELSGDSDSLEVVYIDETSRANGSRWGGVQVYRGAEADTATATKPKFGLWERRVTDMIALSYATERLLRDASALSGVMTEGFATEYAFKLDDEIINGTGADQCLGILNGANNALVTVAKETGQTAATVVTENITNMWSRMPARYRKNAIWAINQEIEPQLDFLQVGVGTAGQLVYLPAGGISGLPYGTLKGRPVVVVEQCAAPGTTGDIMLIDPTQYKVITKDGLQADQSIHVKFLTNERAFRWIRRVNGAPKLKSAITPYKGTKTLSAFIAMATR